MPDEYSVAADKVVAELCSTKLGKALFERAKWKVVAEQLAEQLAAMQQPAPTEPPSPGWDVPSDG